MQSMTGAENRENLRIAAVMGHADQAEMLRGCISHHLAAGCDAIFVSLNRDDEESAAVVDEISSSAEVKGAPVREFARSEFDFLTDAVRKANCLFRPDYILVIDSDEFCVAESGGLKRVLSLSSADLLSVPRYNAALTMDGEANRDDPKVTLSTRVIRRLNERQAQHFTALRPELSWLASRIGPKIIVRPAAVKRVRRGGHAIDSEKLPIVPATATSLAIVHFPFTTLDRFKDKLEGIRARIGSFESGEAGHWRSWLRTVEEGRLEELFTAQFFTTNEVEMLEGKGLIESIGSILRRAA